MRQWGRQNGESARAIDGDCAAEEANRKNAEIRDNMGQVSRRREPVARIAPRLLIRRPLRGIIDWKLGCVAVCDRAGEGTTGWAGVLELM
jgi:hypothetical protein